MYVKGAVLFCRQAFIPLGIATFSQNKDWLQNSLLLQPIINALSK